MKIIELLNRIAKGEEVPKQIKTRGMIWTYEKGFSQYKNSNFQELIKYLNGYYNNFEIGLTYKAILNYEVEIIEEEKEIATYNIDNMKSAGEKAGEVYRRLYEGFKKGWNAPIKEEKEIEKIENSELEELECLRDVTYFFQERVNELIDVINDMRDKE